MNLCWLLGLRIYSAYSGEVTTTVLLQISCYNCMRPFSEECSKMAMISVPEIFFYRFGWLLTVEICRASIWSRAQCSALWGKFGSIAQIWRSVTNFFWTDPPFLKTLWRMGSSLVRTLGIRTGGLWRENYLTISGIDQNDTIVWVGRDL